MKKTLKNNLMNRKRGMVISIVLVVIFALVVIAITLTYFNVRQKDITTTITSGEVVDNVYVDEFILNYHLQKIFDASVVDLKPDDAKSVFITNFNSELDKYRDSNGKFVLDTLGLVVNQVKEDNLVITPNKLVFTVNIQMSKYDTKNKVQADYLYAKSFEKVFVK